MIRLYADVLNKAERLINARHGGDCDLPEVVRIVSEIQRTAIIEECARVVERSYIDSGGTRGLDSIAAAIRALKDKP